MSVSSITSSTTGVGQTNATSSSFRSRMEEGRKAMASLEEALGSGDLEKAKSAFETMKKNAPPPPPDEAEGTSSVDGKKKKGPQADFEALQKALESNDLEAAKSALETIQSHHKGHRQDQQASAQTDWSFNTDTTGTVGTLMNLVA